VRAGRNTLARNHQRITAKAGSGGNSAGNGARLTILESKNPVRAPAAEKRIHGLRAGLQKLLAMAHRKFIDAAYVKYFRIVEVT
jgi:hypothetical protein